MTDDWDAVVEFHENGLLFERYADVCKGMLDLITLIRENSLLAEAKVGSAMLALTVGIPGSTRRVHVLWVSSGRYAIFLDYCGDTFYGGRVEVGLEDAIPTILNYLKRLRECPGTR